MSHSGGTGVVTGGGAVVVVVVEGGQGVGLVGVGLYPLAET